MRDCSVVRRLTEASACFLKQFVVESANRGAPQCSLNGEFVTEMSSVMFSTLMCMSSIRSPGGKSDSCEESSLEANLSARPVRNKRERAQEELTRQVLPLVDQGSTAGDRPDETRDIAVQKLGPQETNRQVTILRS